MCILFWITELASGSTEDAITQLRSRRPMSRTDVGEIGHVRVKYISQEIISCCGIFVLSLT